MFDQHGIIMLCCLNIGWYVRTSHCVDGAMPSSMVARIAWQLCGSQSNPHLPLVDLSGLNLTFNRLWNFAQIFYVQTWNTLTFTYLRHLRRIRFAVSCWGSPPQPTTANNTLRLVDHIHMCTVLGQFVFKSTPSIWKSQGGKTLSHMHCKCSTSMVLLCCVVSTLDGM